MRKTLFRLIILTIVLVISAGLFLIGGCNKNDEAGDDSKASSTLGDTDGENLTVVDSIGIMADIHIMTEEVVGNPTSNEYQNYIKYKCFQSTLEYSEAIFLSEVDAYIKSGVKTMFLIGDLTHHGDVNAMEVIKKGCDKFKAAGIDVYTTLGICDIYYPTTDGYLSAIAKCSNWDTSDFQSIFYNYMGAEPYSVDSGSYSYAVDIPNSDITLISLDASSNMKFGKSSNVQYVRQNESASKITQTVSNDLLAWLEDALVSSTTRNKVPVIITYFPIDENLAPYMGSATNEIYLFCNRKTEIANLCIKYGVKAVFNGQIHMMSETTYTNDSGSFQEFSVGSAITYPLPISVYNEMSNGTFQSSITNLQSVKEEYMPSYTTKEAKAALIGNPTSLARQHVVDNYIGFQRCELYGEPGLGILSIPEELYDKLTLLDKNNPKCIDALDAMIDWMISVNDLPIYGTEKSVESICAQYGISLPKGDFTNVRDYMCKMVCSLYDGTFDMAKGGTNFTIFKYTFYAGFYLMAKSNPLYYMHALDDSVICCDMMPMIDKLFYENVLDLTKNDILCSAMSLIAIPVNSKMHMQVIKVTDTQSYLSVLENVLSIALPLMGDYYNAATDLIWGIPYKQMLVFDQGLVNADIFFDHMAAQFITRNATKYK